MLKRLIYFFLVLFILLVIAIIAIPIIFKSDLQNLASEEINKSINAKFDFKDVDVSLIRSFPDFSVCLQDYDIQGIDQFEGISLAKGKSLCINANVWSVISKSNSIEVKSVYLDEPNINIVVTKSGKANYDITKPSEEAANESTSGESYQLNLDNYEIADGAFSYIDKASGLYMHAEQINHKGTGSFKSTIFDLITETTANNVIFSTGGINYISKAAIDLDAIFNVDLDNSKYTLKENQLKLNALQLNADGYVQTIGDDIKMDLKFNAPANSLKEIISLVPGAYTKDYSGVSAEGAVKFNGFAKGTYSDSKKQIPAFALDVDIKQGNVQYPDLPMGIKDINSTISIKSPSSNFDDMVIDIPQLNLNVANEPFEGRLLLKTPMSDPDIDTKMKGKLDLAQVAKAFPMEGVKSISGLIDADFKIKTKMSTLDKGDYERADMSGKLAITDMNYEADGTPLVVINQLQVDFIPQFLKINQFDAKLGKSDIKASGKVDNFLAYFSPEKTMKGNLVISSTFFDADEWIAEEEATPTTVQNTDVAEDEAVVFDRFDFTLDTKVDRIKYSPYDLRNNALKGHFTSNEISLDNFETNIGKSDFRGRGNLKNVFGYLFDRGTLKGKLSLKSDYLNANEFLADVPTEAESKSMANEEEIEPFLVPENIEIDITADIAKMLYTDLDITNVKGKIEVKDEALSMDKVNMKTLGGNMNISGLYNTKDTDTPKFELKYGVDKLNFKQTFQKFNTFKALAPMAQFMNGDFSTDLSFNGLLGKDMYPDLNTLSADGFIQTFNAVLNNFEPLEKVGKVLNIDWLRTIKLDDSKNWFTVEDGLVTLKESKHKIRDIDMLIGGTSGLNTDMDYTIKAKIPKKYLGNNAVTQAANTGLNFLNKEAAKLGVNIANGDFVNVLISITGSMTNPKIKLTPTGAEGQSVKDVATNVINQVKETVRDTVTKVVTAKVDDGKERLAAEKAKLEAEADAKIAAIRANAQKQVDAARAAAKKQADMVRDKAYAEADKAVDKVKNPLQKIAAREAAKIAKKQADKAHAAALDKVDGSTKKIMNKADDETKKIRAKYDQRISDLEDKAGM